MSRSWIRTACLASLVITAGSQAAWKTVKITVLNTHHKPFSRAFAELMGVTIDGYTSDENNLASSLAVANCDSTGTATFHIDSINSSLKASGYAANGVTFDSLYELLAATKLDSKADTAAYEYHCASSSSYCTASKIDTSLAVNAPNVGDSIFVDTVIVDYKWTPSPDSADSGTFTIPGVPYQILYDPPGGASSVSIMNTSSQQTNATVSFGTNAGVTLEFSYNSNGLIVSNEFSVSASVNYTYNKDNTFAVQISKSTTLAKDNSGLDASMYGPGRGDVFLCPKLKMHWQLKRAYAPWDSAAYSVDGYVYRLFYNPISDPANADVLTSAAQLNRYFPDTTLLNRVLAASVIDPVTRRIRSDLVDRSTGAPIGNRLQLLDNVNLSVDGGNSVTKSSDSSVTQSTTVTTSLAISTTVSDKLTIAKTVSIGGSITAGVTIGGVHGSTQTMDRQTSYTVYDPNSWDKITIRTYLDRVYGVYVFDVDSSDSWTSFPFEDGYSRPAVMMDVSTDHDTLALAPGAVDTFRLAVTNASRSGCTVVSDCMGLDTIHAVSASIAVNSGADVSAPSGTWNILRNAPTTFKVAASATNTGTYPLEVNLSGTVQGIAYIQTKHLTLRVGNEVGIAESKSVATRLVNMGSAVRVECEAGKAWTLQVRDLEGRLLLERAGTGTQSVPLASVHGVAVQELLADGQRLRQIAVPVR